MSDKNPKPIPLEKHKERVAVVEGKYFGLQAQVRSGTATLETFRQMDTAFDDYVLVLKEDIVVKPQTTSADEQ